MKSVAMLSAMALLAPSIEGHGRMIKPPHRGYIGKLSAFSGLVPINYDDDGLSAGGIGGTQGGNHGVCGDPYNGVRQHETGGKYGLFPKHGSRVIGSCYAPGATVDIQVQITANHWGYFTFGLCKLNSKDAKETEECFQTLSQPNGQTKWPVPRVGDALFTIPTTLPAGVTCEGDSHCVLRWWYVAGNNPGGLNNQEQFWNCADIYISNTCGATPPTSPPTSSPSTSSPVTTSAAPNTTPKPVPTAPATPKPSTSGPTPPPSGDCGTCTNCYYAPTKACFAGWSKDQCATNPAFKWCGA